MAYTLDRFSADCRAALLQDPGPAGRELVRQYTERACSDPEFNVTAISARTRRTSATCYKEVPMYASAFSPMSIAGRRAARRTITARAGPCTARRPA